MSIQEKFIGESSMKDTPSKKIGLKIKDGIVSTEKLSNGAVTSIKIANGAVGQMQLDSESQTVSVIQQDNTNPVSSDAVYDAVNDRYTKAESDERFAALHGDSRQDFMAKDFDGRSLIVSSNAGEGGYVKAERFQLDDGSIEDGTTSGMTFFVKRDNDSPIPVSLPATNSPKTIAFAENVEQDILQSGIYDISTENSGRTYVSLSTALADIPQDKRKGGMTVKFILSSDNKYCQYLLTKNTWSTNANDWEKINLEGYINGQNNYPGILPIEILNPNYCRIFKGFFGLDNNVLKLYTGDGRNHVVCRVTPGQTIELTSSDSSHRVSVWLFSAYYNEDDGNISGISLTTDSTKNYIANASTVSFTVPSDTYYLAFNIYGVISYPSKIVVNGNDVTESIVSAFKKYSEDNNVQWEQNTTINYETGVRTSEQNRELSGFIPLKTNNCLITVMGCEMNTSAHTGLALYATEDEGSFIAPVIKYSTSQTANSKTIVFIPKEANYIKLTRHTTRNPSPYIDYGKLEEDVLIKATPIQFIDGAALLMGNSFVVGATVIPTLSLNENSKCAIIECKEGEVYTINGVSNGVAKIYGIVDADNKVLITGSAKVVSDEKVTIPATAKYLYISTNITAPCSYKGSTHASKLSFWQGINSQFYNLEEYKNYQVFFNENSETLSVKNDIVTTEEDRDFLKVDYSDDLVNYTRSERSYFDISDFPNPALIPVYSSSTNSNAKFKLYNEDGSIAYSETIAFIELKHIVKIWNLQPDYTYHWELKNSAENTLLSKGAITPQGYPRWVKVMAETIADRVENVRDLGGWSIGVAQRVKYGVVFRGSDMNWSHTINQDGINVMLNDLHIGYDMDLRSPTEYTPFLEESPLGETVEWGNFPVIAYDISNFNAHYYADAINQIATNLNDGIVTYFHCSAGADRTGTLSLLLLGLLGVSESDLSKEYELTKNRNRNVVSEQNRDIPHLMATIKSYAGSTLKDKIETWALDKGVTQSSINTIRNLMIVQKNL